MSGTSKPIQQELEKFFIATDEPEDNKLEIVGWKGPKIAMKAIKDSAKSFGDPADDALCRTEEPGPTRHADTSSIARPVGRRSGQL